MDFHSLTRRALQALCKKNKIPANLTNVAMADALQSLEFVDGIEEILNSCESETANSSMESPGNSEIVTSVPRTCRRATQQKAIKHDPETLQTLTRSRCITRGKVVRDADEAKNDMHETPALPTTRRRAAATSVRAKLESAMKECEPKEKIGDRIHGEMKDVPKTPAVLTSQRKELKASSVRKVYSTRRSARIAGKPMPESTQENEMSGGTLTFDAFPEETEENLEVDSEQYSIHKNEEVDKNGQDSNTLVQTEIETEDVLQQESNNNLVVVLDTKAEEGSEEVTLGHNNNDGHMSKTEELENGKEMASEEMQSLNDVSGVKIEVFGEESIEESEIDQAQAKTEKDFQNKSRNLGEDTKRSSDITNVILMKQPHEEDKPHCDDTSDFVAENDREEEDHLNHTDVAGGKKLMGEPASVNRDTTIDFHEVSSLGKFNGEGEAKVSGSQQCLKDASEANMEDAGEEEPMEEYEVDHAEANVDSAAHGLEVAEEEKPMEESEVDYAEANVDNAAHGEPASVNRDTTIDFHEVSSLGQFNGEGEAKVSGSQQCLKDASEANMEDAGEEEPMEEYEVDHAEANVDSAAHDLEVAEEEKPMEESEVDYAEANVDNAAHGFPHLASLIPDDAAQEGECDVKMRGNQQCLHVSEVVAGEEPMEESEIDHAAINVDIAAHALPPQASPIPMEESEIDHDAINLDIAAHALPPQASPIPMEESEIDHAAINVDIAAHALPPQASPIPNAIPEPVYKGIAGNDSKQSLQDLSLRQLRKILKESEIDHAVINVDIAAHALPPQASPIHNAIPEPVYKGIAGNGSKQSLQHLSLRQLTKILKERHKRS